jgi:hypothetical protein
VPQAGERLYQRQEGRLSDREHKIRQRAYTIWQGEGEPHGRDEHHWSQAEAEVDAGETPAPAAAQKRVRRVKAAEGENAVPAEPKPAQRAIAPRKKKAS